MMVEYILCDYKLVERARNRVEVKYKLNMLYIQYHLHLAVEPQVAQSPPYLGYIFPCGCHQPHHTSTEESSENKEKSNVHKTADDSHILMISY